VHGTARPGRYAGVVLTLLACGPAEQRPARSVQGRPLDTAVPAPSATSALPPSVRTAPGCAGGPTRVVVNTLEPGGLLVWNATGTALAVGRYAGRSFWPLASSRKEDQWGSVAVVDLATRQVRRAPAHGVARALAQSDGFVIAADTKVVITKDGRLSPGADAPAEASNALEPPAVPPRTVQAIKARIPEVAGSPSAAWATNERGDRSAVGTDKLVRIVPARSEQPTQVVSLPDTVLALAFRPGSTDLAAATTTSVVLVHETGATELIATRVAEPPQWSAAVSPTGRTLAVHLGGQVVARSLVDGSAYPTFSLDGPSTGSYEGLVLPSDIEVTLPQPFGKSREAWTLANSAVRTVPGALSPDRSIGAFVDGAGVRLESKAGTVRLAPERRAEPESPTLLALAFRPDSQALLLMETLNLPRSAGGRVSAFAVSDGRLLWSEDVDEPNAMTPTARGVITESSVVERFEDGRNVFSVGRAPYAYSPERDLLAVVDGRRLDLVGRGGAPLVWRLPFPEKVVSLAFDAGGQRLALGTKRGLHVLDVGTLREVVSTELTAETEALGFRGDLAIVRRVSADAPERSFALVDVRSGASLTFGFVLTTSAAPALFASSSNGWVDADPAVLAALRDADHPDVPVPAACVRPGLLREWLEGPG